LGSVQLLTSSLGAATDAAVAGEAFAGLAGLPARAGEAEASASTSVSTGNGTRIRVDGAVTAGRTMTH